MKNEPEAIEIKPFSLGPIENNTFLVIDPASREAVVIDPSFEIQPLVDHIKQRQLNNQIHSDHPCTF